LTVWVVTFRLQEKEFPALDSLKTDIENKWRRKFVRLLEENHNERACRIVLNRRSTRKIFETVQFHTEADPVLLPPGSRLGRAIFMHLSNRKENLKIGNLVLNMTMIC
jgi:hypothetical protein